MHEMQDISDPGSWPFDRELDALGLDCPLPVLMARKRLAAMRPGEALLVAASDEMAAIDIPHLCHQDGHRLARSARIDGPAGERLYFLIVANGSAAAGGPANGGPEPDSSVGNEKSS